MNITETDQRISQYGWFAGSFYYRDYDSDGFEFSPDEEGVKVTETLEGFSFVPHEDILPVAKALLSFSRPLTKDELIHLPVGSIVLAKRGNSTTALRKAGWGHWLRFGDTDTITAAEVLGDGYVLTLIHDGSDG